MDIEQYDESQPDKYLRGLWQKETDFSVLKAYRSYFSIVASAPMGFDNFTRLINDYRQKPPFNYRNPLANVGGVVQVTKNIVKINKSNFEKNQKLMFFSFEEKKNVKLVTRNIACLFFIYCYKADRA